MMSDEEDEMYSYFLPHGIADDDLGDVHAPLPQHLHLDASQMQLTDDGDEMGHAAATAMSAAVGALGDGDEMSGYENLYYRNQALATRQPMISSMRIDSPSHVSRAPVPSPPSWQQEYANRKAIAAAAQTARLGGYAPPTQPPTLSSATSAATPTSATSSYGTSAFGERRTSPPFFGGVTPSSTSTSSSASASSSISSQLLPQNLYYGHTPAPLTRAPSATSRLPAAPAAPTRPAGRGYGAKAGVLCRNGPHCNNPTCEYDHPDPQALALALAAQKLPLYETPVYRPTGAGLNVDVVSTLNTSAPVFHASTPTSAYGSEINESPASVMSDQTGFGSSFKDEDYAFPRSTSNATRPVGAPARTTSAGVAVGAGAGAVGARTTQRSVPSSPADVAIPRVTEANVAPASRKEIWPKTTTTTTTAPSTPVITAAAVPVAVPPVAVASKEVTSPPAAAAAAAATTTAAAATPAAAKETPTGRTSARPAGVTIIKRITATGTTIIPTSGNIAPVTIPRDVDESDSSESESENETAPVVRVNQTLSQPDKKKPVTTNSVTVTTTTTHPAPEPEPTTAASPTVEESEDESPSSSESEAADDETRSKKGSDADKKPVAAKRVSFTESKPVPAISNKKLKAAAREQAAREAAQAANAAVDAGNASPASATCTGDETPPSQEATVSTPTTSDATTAATATAAHLSKKTKKMAAKELRRQQAAAAAASKKAQKSNEKKEEKKEESAVSAAPDATASPTTAAPAPGPSPALSVVILTFLSSLRTRAVDAIDTDALRTWSGVAAHRSWSIATWCAGLALGLCWTLLCMIARVHKHAASVLTVDHHLAFCFTFLYVFPYLVNYVSYWAPPWAAPCLWYAFLMQVFCTQGSPVLVAIFRVLLPLLFLTEGVAHHSFLLELNGAERLVVAFVLSAFRTQEYYRPTFLFSLSAQLLTALLYGANLIVQWAIFLIAILVIHTQERQQLKRERDRVAADKKKGQQAPFTPAGVGIPGQAGYVPGAPGAGGVVPGAAAGGVAGNGLAAGVAGAGAVAGAAGGASPAGPATGGAYGSWPSVSGFSAADAAASASGVPPTAAAGAPAAAATTASAPMSGLAGLLNRRRPKAGLQKSRRVSRW